MIHILTYIFSPNYLEERKPHRTNHFEHLKPYINGKQLLLGGATETESPDGILIFDKLSKEEIKTFAQSDPYVINNVVTSYKIQQWNVVAGSLIHNINSSQK